MSQTQWNPSIFREYDIRGIAGKDLSPEFAHQLGLAFGELLKGSKPVAGRNRLTVSVGRDCRLSSDAYGEAMIRGLTEAGFDVINIGVCPSPLSYFSVFHLELDGSVMITGSHNPADYNGFKISWGKSTIHGETIQKLRQILSRRLSPVSDQGDVRSFEIIPAYLDHVAKNAAKSIRPKKVVLDAGNGTASTVAPPLFERLGAKVIPLFCTLDGRFPNHHPDPTVPANLRTLVETVRKEKADFGVAFDGDSDRIGLVDETGRIIYGDELLILYSRALLKEHPGATIISEVKSSHRLYLDIAQRGGKGIMWKTGHSLIKSKMKETGALLAGEMSGHVFFADRYFGYDDAIYAAVRVLEIASQHNGPLSELLADLPPTHTTPEIRVDCQEELKFKLVESVKKTMRDNKMKLNDIDGVRVDFADGWGLLRASNTQPVLVMRYESTTKSGLDQIRGTMEGALLKAAQGLGHPPLNLEGGAH
jgi:phosphomannomutase/phosphoglucomutase